MITLVKRNIGLPQTFQRGNMFVESNLRRYDTIPSFVTRLVDTTTDGLATETTVSISLFHFFIKGNKKVYTDISYSFDRPLNITKFDDRYSRYSTDSLSIPEDGFLEGLYEAEVTINDIVYVSDRVFNIARSNIRDFHELYYTVDFLTIEGR